MKTKPNKYATGCRFGMLTIVSLSHKGSKYRSVRCDCGAQKDIRTDHLGSGRSQSCGCSKIKHNATSGGQRTPTYQSWRAMLNRCSDASNPNYGQKGIKVCDRWLSYSNFLADMGPRPHGMTLDRKQVMNGYHPANCQWATVTEQRDNRGDVKHLDYDIGAVCYSLTVREWAVYLSGRTATTWTAKFLKELLTHLSLDQVLGATSDFRRTPQELVQEKTRRDAARRDAMVLGNRIQQHGTGYIPRGRDALTNAEIDALIHHAFGSDCEPDPEPPPRNRYEGLPERMTEAQWDTVLEIEQSVLA